MLEWEPTNTTAALRLSHCHTQRKLAAQPVPLVCVCGVRVCVCVCDVPRRPINECSRGLMHVVYRELLVQQHGGTPPEGVVALPECLVEIAGKGVIAPAPICFALSATAFIAAASPPPHARPARPRVVPCACCVGCVCPCRLVRAGLLSAWGKRGMWLFVYVARACLLVRLPLPAEP